MKRRINLFRVSIAIAVVTLSLTACTSKNETTSTTKPMEAPAKATLDISFHTTPEKPNPNVVPTLQATVKQNNTAITDARVDFEVWKDGMTTHQTTTTTHTKDGIYIADAPLKEAGEYKVIVHVSTKNGLEQTTESSYKVTKKEKCCEGANTEKTVQKKHKHTCCEDH